MAQFCPTPLLKTVKHVMHAVTVLKKKIHEDNNNKKLLTKILINIRTIFFNKKLITLFKKIILDFYLEKNIYI